MRLNREIIHSSKVINTKDYGNIPHNRENFIICFDYDEYPNVDGSFKFLKKKF